MATGPHVVVIGAGVHGLCTAWQLLLRGARVTVLERFEAGHRRGSSHGSARITRASYGDPMWVRLMEVVRSQEWPRLEAAAGTRLVHPRPGCFFGPRDGSFSAFADAVLQAGAAVDSLSLSQARQRFPQFRFFDGDGVLHDHSAGVVAAADTLAALTELVRADATLRYGARLLAIEGSGPLRLILADGHLDADLAVLTAGPWAAALLPQLAPYLSVARQSVGFYDVGPTVADFPVWAWLGPTFDDLVYGLPERGRPLLKAACHLVSGRRDDPERTDVAPDLTELDAFLKHRFAQPPGPAVAAETCLYTNTPSEDFVLDRLPDRPAITVGAGFSGHGFKLAPLTGRILAELALTGDCTVAPFSADRARFSMARATG